jgi:hypothetical protein
MQIDKSNKSLLIGLVGVLTLFMVLVPVYFAFSNGLPDGLDKQLQQNHIQEKKSVYTPPFGQLIDYGSDVPSYIINGLIGGAVVLSIGVLLALILKGSAVTTTSIKTTSKSERNIQLRRKR